ncbi:hypothetical protein LTS10_012435 [Elasticomyces elasticus]|nr:hypothetical protein LTS10_012435 [Elasticomyces elasticus]
MVSFLDGENADEFLRLSGMCPQGQRTQDDALASGPECTFILVHPLTGWNILLTCADDTSNYAMLPPPPPAPSSPFPSFVPSALSPPPNRAFGDINNFDIEDFDLFDGITFEDDENGVLENNRWQNGENQFPASDEHQEEGQAEELDHVEFPAGSRYTAHPAAHRLRPTEHDSVSRATAATAPDLSPLYPNSRQMHHPPMGLFGMPGNIAPNPDYFPATQMDWNDSLELDPMAFGGWPSGNSTFGSLSILNNQPPPAQTWRNDSYDWDSLSLPINQPQQPNSSQTTRDPYPMPSSSHNRSMRDFGHIPTPAELAFGIAPFVAQTGDGMNEPFGASNTPHTQQQQQPQAHPVRYRHRRQERALDTSAFSSPPASFAAQQGYGMQQPHLQQAQPPFSSSYAPPTGHGLNSTASQMPPPIRPSQYGQIGMRRQSTQPTSSSDSHGFGSSSSISSDMAGTGMWRDHLGNTGVLGHHGQDEALLPPRLRRRAPRSPQLDPARIEDLAIILDDSRHQPNTAAGTADSAPESLGPSSRLRRRRQPTSTQGAVRPTSSSSSGTNITRRKPAQRDAGRTTDDRKRPTKVTKASLRTPGEERKQTKEASKGSRKGKSSNRIIGHNPELERGQAAQADVALPETRATGVELLCFFPNHTQWPGVLRRLTDAGWRDEEIAAARLYFRGAVQEDRVERHWRQIRKQQKWAKDVESVEDYGLSSFAPRKTQRYKEPQHELLAEIGRNVVEWPEQAQQSFLTLAIIYAIAHPEMGYTTDDVEWLAASLGWVLPCDFTNDRLDEQGHDEVMKAMEDDGFW